MAATVQAMNREDCPGALFKVTSLLRPVPGASGTDQPLTEIEWKRRIGSGRDLHSRGTRVLVVDDEADAREVVTLILERCGARVFAAVGG